MPLTALGPTLPALHSCRALLALFSLLVCAAAVPPRQPVPNADGADPYTCEAWYQGFQPAKWHYFRGHMYHLLDVFGSRDDQQIRCKSMGADLVKITSREESDFVISMMPKPPAQKWSYLWIGLSKGHWKDGSVANYTPWAPGQPTDPKYKCVEIYIGSWPAVNDLNWHDNDCGVPSRAVCEKDANPSEKQAWKDATNAISWKVVQGLPDNEGDSLTVTAQDNLRTVDEARQACVSTETCVGFVRNAAVGDQFFFKANFSATGVTWKDESEDSALWEFQYIRDRARIPWTPKMRLWCCDNMHLGCHYDCAAGLFNWQVGWASAKRAWCCDHAGVACGKEVARKDPFDCTVGLSKWSDKQKKWCCAHQDVGCYECKQVDRPEPWTEKQRDWCCEHERVGCFTCGNDTRSWGLEQRMRCCQSKHICPEVIGQTIELEVAESEDTCSDAFLNEIREIWAASLNEIASLLGTCASGSSTGMTTEDFSRELQISASGCPPPSSELSGQKPVEKRSRQLEHALVLHGCDTSNADHSWCNQTARRLSEGIIRNKVTTIWPSDGPHQECVAKLFDSDGLIHAVTQRIQNRFRGRVRPTSFHSVSALVRGVSKPRLPALQYNCVDGAPESWPTAQQDWCCDQQGIGCNALDMQRSTSCFLAEKAWEPIDMFGTAVTVEGGIFDCQDRCRRTLGCAHFTWYAPLGNCHIESADAKLHRGRHGFTAGSPHCEANKVKAWRCYHPGYYYTPTIRGKTISLKKVNGITLSVRTAARYCRAHCRNNQHCARFVLQMPQMLCHLAGAAALPVRKARSISGPPVCNDHVDTLEDAPSGTYQDLGAGCCSGYIPSNRDALFDSPLGDLDQCKLQCESYPNCGFILHDWGSNASDWCTVLPLGRACAGLRSGPLDCRFGGNTGVRTYRYYAKAPTLPHDMAEFQPVEEFHQESPSRSSWITSSHAACAAAVAVTALAVLACFASGTRRHLAPDRHLVERSRSRGRWFHNHRYNRIAVESNIISETGVDFAADSGEEETHRGIEEGDVASERAPLTRATWSL